MRLRAGFTLMELLVVLLIIGILSTVAVRTIDATRNRALFDQTTAEMQELVNAIVGNPNLAMDGRRIDYGYFGDLGRLPDSLRNLAVNIGDGDFWKGPYLRQRFLGDSVGYLFDGWGNPYTYNRVTGEIATIGDGKFPMTIRIADALEHLTDNSIVGTVVDTDNNPPNPGQVFVRLELSSGALVQVDTDASGYYSLSPVPIGTHRLVAFHLFDSITRWVSVSPRTRNVIDFRFSQPFRDFLEIVGSATGFDSTLEYGPGFEINIVNRHELDVSVSGVTLVEAPDNAYFRSLVWDGVPYGYPVPDGEDGYGRGATMPIDRLNPNDSRTIQGNRAQIIRVSFLACNDSLRGTGGPADIWEPKFFRLRFSDGSMTRTFTVPDPGGGGP